MYLCMYLLRGTDKSETIEHLKANILDAIAVVQYHTLENQRTNIGPSERGTVMPTTVAICNGNNTPIETIVLHNKRTNWKNFKPKLF